MTHEIRYRHQQGAVLITALVLLLVLTMLGLASMSTTTLEERMAANSQESNRAFQAAESGLEFGYTQVDAFDLNKTVDNPNTFTEPNFGSYGADVDISIGYRQATAPRRGSGWDSNYALYHFDTTSRSLTNSGASAGLHAGAYQVGKKI